MKPTDSRRRKRRIFLLLCAILIPTAVVVLLLFRVVRQETELSQSRMADGRREALDQLRREMAARLQAIRVEEVNRLIGESGTRLPPESPIVFVATLGPDRMVLPWEENAAVNRTARKPTPYPTEGETLEFRANDPSAAAIEYKRSLIAARTPVEKCEALLPLGRAYSKAGKTQASEKADHDMLKSCDSISDSEGIPYSLYAAQRLLANNPNDAAAQNYVVHNANIRRWRPPNEAYLLKSLLGAIPNAEEPLRELTSDIHEMEQIVKLTQDIYDHIGKLQSAFRSAPGDLSWMGYGDEPWLITVVSPASFAAPVVLAVSSRKVVPNGEILHTERVRDAMPLGDGFVDLHVEWPANRFPPPRGVPAILYVSSLCLVLGATFLAAYLLLRDVHREVETAAMRSNFVASVSHELKTPLTAIRAVAETLLLGRADSEQATPEYLRTIVSESDRLTRLVDNVLEFSRIEQGRKIYRMQSMRLADVVRSAAKAMEYPLSQLGFTLTFSTDDTSQAIQADADALKQALLNLIGNAMKYSGSARHIEMCTGTRDDEAFVDIVDHGIGISREEQSRIFEKFHRVRSVETSGIAGTGLGLGIALHIVEAHKGRIEVSSDPGCGSTFSIRIPLQEQA